MPDTLLQHLPLDGFSNAWLVISKRVSQFRMSMARKEVWSCTPGKSLTLRGRMFPFQNFIS